MTEKQKAMRKRILAAAVLYIPLFLLDLNGKLEWGVDIPVRLVLFLIPYIVVGGDVLWRAARNIRNGQVFDENFLMGVATLGAFAVEEYAEAVAVMLFYQIGELFQDYAVGKSRQSIRELMEICPEYANVERDGDVVQVDPDEVCRGERIFVKAGERIPLDGVVEEGQSFIDTSALTGESVPRRVEAGNEVISGCVNGSGVLKIRTTKEFEDSTVTKILELVENAGSKKARVENFITRFARYYTPAVVGAAAALAVILPLATGAGISEGIRRACLFLVISCPCALVISVPMGFFGGIGAASRQGVLVKGSNYLELLAQIRTIVFDKTGTLTKGEFCVTEICPEKGTKEELLELASQAEWYSNHPIATALKTACGKAPSPGSVTDVEEIPGYGVRVKINGTPVVAGNGRMLEKEGISYVENTAQGTLVYLARDGKFEGSVAIADALRPETAEALRSLRESGVERLVMLTGDRREIGEAVAKDLGMDQVYTQLLPADKVDRLEQLLQEAQGKGKLAFVGDGINDAPVLTRADVGIAMGGVGSDAAIEAADVVLMHDDPRKIAVVRRIAGKTLRIVKQNIVFALGVKLLVLLLGALGAASMWAAVFADVGVSVIAILNSMRTLKGPDDRRKKVSP